MSDSIPVPPVIKSVLFQFEFYGFTLSLVLVDEIECDRIPSADQFSDLGRVPAFTPKRSRIPSALTD
jgi:hypothetical protein